MVSVFLLTCTSPEHEASSTKLSGDAAPSPGGWPGKQSPLRLSRFAYSDAVADIKQGVPFRHSDVTISGCPAATLMRRAEKTFEIMSLPGVSTAQGRAWAQLAPSVLAAATA